jgi:peptidoglycan/xylan/chitin deacetylase (PgdA/CDA1 family)
VITVAVCVAGGSEPAPEAVAALGVRAEVVRAETVWQARRLALARCETEVLAFVDGDVVVPAGWMERLEAAWSEASQEIAAIGGPVRLRGEPSGAVADTIDLGAEALDLDPLERTLIAGNLSFRRAPLLGAGGFAPPVDRRDARDWFAEEHEAQRQLGHWGWLTRWDPGLGAERLTGWDGAPRARRFRYGLRSGVARGRTPARAARAFARAAIGSIAPGRSERRARAAENLGVLLAPVAAPNAWRQRGQWPDPRPATDRQRRATRAGAPLILLYHRIAADPDDPLGLCVSPPHFAEQIEVLRELAEIVPLDELAASHAAGAAARGAIAVTFDDGYADNIPALTGLGIPVTLFAATGHVATGTRFFWDEATRLMRSPDERPTKLNLLGRVFATRTLAERREALRAVHRVVQPSRPEAIETALAELREWSGGADPPPDATRLMTVDELAALAGTGVAIGAHTQRHLNLAHQAEDVIRTEVEGSRDDIADWLGSRPAGFSYPFGIPRHDVDARARRAVAEAGYEYAVVNQPVPVAPGHDRFALPRLFAPDIGGSEFREWLRYNLGSA